MSVYAVDIGVPEEHPDTVVEPLYDPVPKTNPTPIPKEPALPEVVPEREKVPA